MHNFGDLLTPQKHSELGVPRNNTIYPPNQPKTQNDITLLLLQQNRKVHPILGDGNCFFRSLSYSIFHTQQHHLQVRKEIVEFISDHVHLFEALVISDDRTYTLLDHLASVRKPGVWASQVEIQAAVDLYGAPIYLFTPNVSSSGYQWYRFNKRTLAVPKMSFTHIELAHRAGNHFDCILDATTTRPCAVPPLLPGEQAYHSHVL